MSPDQSTTARPWFICPSWAAVVPLLVHTIATAPDSDEAAAAAGELENLARGLDQWNKRIPEALRLLERLRDCLDDDEVRQADILAATIQLTIKGE
jgi:hypothetical protein